ncbi:SDR family oxidoreductase [Microlunatus speluncae]|uniref:SDR family oxidoreductase n=1 Tax=Microlunatus speluncae TaxID=2594267 RepID=UPI00126664B7|nr:SDR family oxidoreductase [Microlunatus speluncae]
MAKIVIIGGTGLVGSKVVTRLGADGHEAVAASPGTGVNTLTGEGVDAALADAQVVVDVTNSPPFEDQAVLDFFTTSTTRLIDAATRAGVGHYVALSVVGTQRLTDSGYFRAKIEQEKLITGSGLPYSIVHATQFFEFVRGIADRGTVDQTVRLSGALIQPIAAADVSTAVAVTAAGDPVDGIREVAGPETFGLDQLIGLALTADRDPRRVVTDPTAPYFDAVLGERTLLPGDDATIFDTRFEDWLVANPR